LGQKSESIEEIKELFDFFDKERTGFIDARILERVLKEMGKHDVTEEDVKRMVRLDNVEVNYFN
jgi:Ca2+-binding EF-hand superfamily protein